MTVAAAVRYIHLAPLCFDRSEWMNAGACRDPRQLEARQHCHHERKRCVDQGRSAHDQRKLAHATASSARKDSTGVRTAPGPKHMRHTFQANTVWLKNMSKPPTPRQT